MLYKSFQVVILVLMVALVCFSRPDENIEDVDIDNVFNLLLSGDKVDTVQPLDEIEGEQPILSDGIWKCGDCDAIAENKVIYSEVNDVDTNDLSDDRPIVVQIGLSLDELMQCVTVAAGDGGVVRRDAGACVSDNLTLAVYNSTHFTVHVYGA